MNDEIHIDQSALLDEIARYLATVELFRSESCEPTWLPESVASPTLWEPVVASALRAPSAH